MNDVRRGFSSLGRYPLEVALERGGEYGFDFVELTMNDYGAEQLTSDADAIRELAAEHGLDLLVHLPHGSDDDMVGSSDESVREESVAKMEASIRAAGAVGAEKAVIHVDTNDALHLLESGDIDELVGTVADLDAFARDHGVELCVENMLGRRPTPRDLAPFAERAGVALTVDTGHARSVGYDDGDIASFVGAHAGSVSHFHLNDTRGTADEHLPFGAGAVDFERIFAALPGGWSGTLTLEITTPEYGYIEFSLEQLDALL